MLMWSSSRSASSSLLYSEIISMSKLLQTSFFLISRDYYYFVSLLLLKHGGPFSTSLQLSVSAELGSFSAALAMRDLKDFQMTWSNEQWRTGTFYLLLPVIMGSYLNEITYFSCSFYTSILLQTCLGGKCFDEKDI